MDKIKDWKTPDLQYNKAVSSTPKASPTTSTSTKFNSLIDREKNRKSKKLELKNPFVNSEEFKLLCKLYLPKRYHLIDPTAAMKQLTNVLPSLLPNSISYPKLDFQLHMFLSSIMANYVCLWYSNKLNTDNMEFLQNVYNVLCEFIRSFSLRLNNVFSGHRILDRLDEWSAIVDQHIKQLAGKREILVVEEYKRSVTVARKTDETILCDYLAAKHVYFTQKRPYLQILVKKILQCIFNDNLNGPLNTQIGSRFVDVLVADLVLVKVIDKLSEPHFILLIISKMVANMKIKLDTRDTSKPKQSIVVRVKSSISTGYRKFAVSMAEENDTYNVVNNRVFQLLNTITGFSDRKPFLVGLITTVLLIMQKNPRISDRINRIFTKTISKHIKESKVLEDESFARIVSSLRQAIFPDAIVSEEAAKKPAEKGAKSIEVAQLAKEIYEVLNHENMYMILDYMKYDNESPQDIIDRITQFLSIFNHSNCNQWLIVKLLDNLIAKMYPELT